MTKHCSCWRSPQSRLDWLAMDFSKGEKSANENSPDQTRANSLFFPNLIRILGTKIANS
jgi:hypothetical protein